MDQTNDQGVIQSTFRHDPEMVELIELFVAELPERVRSLQEMFATGDLAGVRRLAHQLKGASGGYGFNSIGDRAGELEAALRASAGIDMVRRRIDELTDLCSRAAA
jgi:HPt (histidine-containing phosphotransfer) domain-containing protein